MANTDTTTQAPANAPAQPPADPANLNAPAQGADINAPNATQPQVPQNYIPYPYHRSMGEMGKPDFILQGAMNFPGVSPGPYMPQPRDTLGIVRNSGLFLGGMGGMAGGLGMMRFYANYLKARQAGQLQQAQLLHQQYALQSEKVEVDTARRLQAYGEAWSLYGGDKDPNARLKPALIAAANELQDSGMQNLLTSADNWQTGAASYMTRLDNAYGNLAKLNSQRKKASSSTSTAAASGDSGGAYGYPPNAQTDAQQPLIPPEQRYLEEQERKEAPTPSSQPTSPTAADAEPPDIAKIPEDVKQMGRGMQVGQDYKSVKGNEQAISDATAYEAYLQKQMEDAVENLSGDQLLDRIRQLNPTVAGMMPQIKAGIENLPETARYGAAFTRMFSNAMAKVYGEGWGGPQRFAARAAGIKDFEPEGTAGKSLVALGLLGGSEVSLLRSLNNIDPKRPPILNGLDRWRAKNFNGMDARWQAVYEAANDVIQQSTLIQRQGRSARGDVTSRLEHAFNSTSPVQMRAALQVAAQNDNASGETLLKAWDNLQTGQKYPDTFNVESNEVSRAVATRLDPATGFFLGTQPLPGPLTEAEPGRQTPVGGTIPAPRGSKEGQTIKDNRTGQQYIVRGGQAIPFQ